MHYYETINFECILSSELVYLGVGSDDKIIAY